MRLEIHDNHHGIDFEDASKEWRANKKSLGMGEFKYISLSSTKAAYPNEKEQNERNRSDKEFEQDAFLNKKNKNKNENENKIG